MASSPSSGSAGTVPTASTKKMRVRSKSTSAVEDVKEEEVATTKDEKRVVGGVKASLKNGLNGTQNGAETLFVKAPKDKHHDRKSRSGRRGLPKKGGQLLCNFLFAKCYNIYFILNSTVVFNAVPRFSFVKLIIFDRGFVSKHVF